MNTATVVTYTCPDCQTAFAVQPAPFPCAAPCTQCDKGVGAFINETTKNGTFHPFDRHNNDAICDACLPSFMGRDMYSHHNVCDGCATCHRDPCVCVRCWNCARDLPRVNGRVAGVSFADPLNPDHVWCAECAHEHVDQCCTTGGDGAFDAPGFRHRAAQASVNKVTPSAAKRG